MNVIPERLKPGEPLPDLRGINSNGSTISWPTNYNPDTSFPKRTQNFLVEDNLSIPNSCELSKGDSKLEPSSRIPMIPKVQPASAYNFTAKNNLKTTVAAEAATCNIKYPEQISDDDKYSSAYSTGTEQEHDSINADAPRQSTSRIPSASKNASHETRRIPIGKSLGKRLKAKFSEAKSNSSAVFKKDSPRSASSGK